MGPANVIVSVDTEGDLHSTGQPVSVTYMNADGTTDSHEAIALDETMTTLDEGWYVADGTLNYSQTLTLSGDVHLILKDNAVMSVGTEQSRLFTSIGDYNNAHSLNIYGQSTGDTNGQLNVFTEYLGILIMEGDFNCSSARVTIDTYGYGI